MNIIKWFLWRRCKLISFVSDITKEQKMNLMINCSKTNIVGCTESAIIWRDFKRICLGREAAK